MGCFPWFSGATPPIFARPSLDRKVLLARVTPKTNKSFYFFFQKEVLFFFEKKNQKTCYTVSSRNPASMLITGAYPSSRLSLASLTVTSRKNRLTVVRVSGGPYAGRNGRVRHTASPAAAIASAAHSGAPGPRALTPWVATSRPRKSAKSTGAPSVTK